MTIPPEKMQQYISTAKARKQQQLALLCQRQQRGFEIAKMAAQILKTEFAVDRVVLFGSLLGEGFHETSDIDLAVWGLPDKFYFKAVGRLLSLSDFEFDLVEVQSADSEILVAIVQGKEL